MLMNDEKTKDLQECVEKLRKGCKTLVEEFEYSEECAKVFPPATDEEIEELERSLKFPLPEDYKEFLKLANGVIIDHTEICGTDSIIVKDTWLPDGYLAISCSDNTSERLAISKEDGKVYLFWELQPEEWSFTHKLKNVLEMCESDISEYEYRREKEENRKKGITEEQENAALEALIKEKYRKMQEKLKKQNGGQ